jgi:deoxycytidine triphosphate deaminase
MPVIALTTDPNSALRSVVTSSREFNKQGTAILIQDGDIEQLNVDSKECNAGYDLRVGKIFRDHRNEYGQELGEKDKICLLPGNAVIIQTEEWVEFPECRFGQIFPKVRLLQRGISNTPSKVDPGFRGNLLITVFNYGKRKVFLCRYQRFCSLHVINVEGPVRPYEKAPPTIGARRSVAWQQKFGDWIDRNGARVAIIEAPALLVTAAAAVLALVLHG